MVINSKLIFDYICGNDILEYDIDQLENNPKFMLEVIRYSKDKKMYNLCSDEIKKNYEFVKGLLDIFSNDIDFLEKVCDFCLKDRSSFNKIYDITIDDVREREIIVLMNNLLTSKGIKGHKYQCLALLIYESSVLEFEEYKNVESDKELIDDLGNGFSFYQIFYQDSSILIDYIAKRMVIDIFYNDSSFRFEDLIHKYYNNGSITKNKGINNFIISYVNMFDNSLADYVGSHIEIAKDIEIGIKVVLSNWDRYVEISNRRKVDIFYDDVLKCIDKYDLGDVFDVYDVVDYVIEELHLEDIFNKYDFSRIGIKNEEDILDDDSIDYELERDYFNIRTMKKTPIEYKCLKEIVESAKALFYSEIIEIKYDDYDEEKTSVFDGKVISFDSYQRRKRASK